MAGYAATMLTPYLTGAGLAWLYYRRLGRHFGYQPWQPRRTGVRIALMVLVAGLLGWLMVVAPQIAPGMLGGALAGVALGWFALRHTAIERRAGQWGYVPNPWIGGGLAVVLLARLAWRWSQGAFAGGAQQSATQASPLTMAIAATLVAYSLTQAIGLTLLMRRRIAAG
jgi:hypothetical protein